jgi:hypothetical protein
MAERTLLLDSEQRAAPRHRGPAILATLVCAACAAYLATSRRAAPVAGSAALSAAGAADTGKSGRLMVIPLLERVAAMGSQFGNVSLNCSVPFAFCGESSCTRSGNSSAPNDDIEVAACACQSIPASEVENAQIAIFVDGYMMNELFAQSPVFVEILSAWVNESDPSVQALEASVCAALSERLLYPELEPDQYSLPCPKFDDRHPNTQTVVGDATCDDESLASAVCAGAPCFANGADGPLNLTCLCPVYPEAVTTHSLKLSAVDVGHLGGCDAYAYDGGKCTIQGGAGDVGKGDDVREFAVAAVRSMTRAPRVQMQRICHDWFPTP